MFDQTTPAGTDAWHATLERGDVVLFRFPVSDPSGEEGQPKSRPCLVLDVAKLMGRRFIKLAYGTTAERKINRGYEIVVNHPASCAAAGLQRPTRFIGVRTVLVSPDHKGFDTLDGTVSPVIGKLDEPLIERMNAVRARLQAEADIRTATREERRAEQLRWRREARGFRKRNRALLGAAQLQKKGLSQ